MCEIVARWAPTTSRSRSCSPTTTPSCAPGCGCCSSARGGFEVVAEAGDADAALRTVLGHKPTSSCSTSTCPASSARSTRSRACSEVSPDTHVVVLTMQEDPAFARRALRAGARRLRAQGGRRRRARRRRARARPRAARTSTRGSAPRLAAAPPEPSGPPDDLTEREVEVLRLIALGHTNAEIAAAALPLGAHGRVAPRPHPAEARPLHPRRARALRARPRARDHELSARPRRQASGRRARTDGPGLGAGEHAELAAGQLDALAHARRGRSRCRPRRVGVEAAPSSATRHLERAVRRSARRARRGWRAACLTTLVSASWTIR